MAEEKAEALVQELKITNDTLKQILQVLRAIKDK